MQSVARWARVTTDGLGNWVAVWGSNFDESHTYTVASLSTDNGATWTSLGLLNSNADESQSDHSVQVTTDGLGNWVSVWYSGGAEGAATGSDADIFVTTSSDIGPVRVTSTLRLDTNPTNAASVDFAVTFLENVTGVDSSDFALTTAGVTGATIDSVFFGGNSRTVRVNTGTGNGTIRLDVIDDDSIADTFGGPLGGTGAENGDFTAGEEYTIDRTAPTVSIGPPSVATTQSGPVELRNNLHRRRCRDVVER